MQVIAATQRLFKVVEYSVKADGACTIRDHKSGMPAHKARALADKLNTAQDHEAGECLLSYQAQPL